jgi:acetyl-CoA carboxylase carboxyl transferase subunit alpha
MMLQYATYSVISPEGCASILWKTAEKAAEAADAMNITAERLKGLDLINQIIPEPLGGAHCNHTELAKALSEALETNLKELKALPIDELLEQRYQRLMSFGRYEE